MKISIITVTYNSAATIEQTILSVISQDYADIEYIIVDGKSTDDTLKIVETYKNRIATILSEKDNGLYDALNTNDIHTIQLRTSANAVLYSATVNLSIGANTVTLNFPLSTGVNYRLALSNTSTSGLYRTNTGVAYPYNIGGCVSIKASNTGNTTYFYFYNWKVTPQGCASSRVPAVVNVTPGPTVSMSAPTGPVCESDVIDLQGTPAGGTYMGSILSGALFYADAGAGTYTVAYSYTDANNCTNTTDAAIIVEECTGISKQSAQDHLLMIYPNPAKENLVIKTEVARAQVSISDASGRLVLVKDLSAQMEDVTLSGLANGMYIISVQDAGGRTLKTMKFVKE